MEHARPDLAHTAAVGRNDGFCSNVCEPRHTRGKTYSSSDMCVNDSLEFECVLLGVRAVSLGAFLARAPCVSVLSSNKPSATASGHSGGD